ncbi:hypothetical protein CL622_01865 [archaeon]|nr:hypothetical protein [archaeon]
MSWLQFLGGPIEAVSNVFAKKEERRKAVKLSQIDRLKNAEDSLAEWELIQAENGRYSWKDEYWTIVLSLPLIGAFIPPVVPFIVAGFEAIQKMPQFYQYWVGVAILTSFGVRLAKK